MELGVALLTSVAGIALIVGILSEVIKRAWNPTPEQQDRWLPLLNLALGTILGVIGAVMIPDVFPGRQEILAGAVTGFFGGASAGGLYDVVRGIKKTT